MARSRTIRPEFWDDEKLASVSRDSRLFFVGLWKCSDDYGVTRGNTLWLKNQVFPYDDLKISQVEKWLNELVLIGAIITFTHNEEKFFYIKNFSKYQKVDHPSKVRNPKPPASITESLASVSRDFRDETETETETIKTLSGKQPDVSHDLDDFTKEAKTILEFLNQKTGKNYEPVPANMNMIKARLKERVDIGKSIKSVVDDVKSIIAMKCSLWRGDEKMEQNLRPKTIFDKTLFANYVGQLHREVA